MLNNGGFSNGANNVSINTRLYGSFTEASALYIIAWNEKLTLRYSPCIGKSADGIKQYAKEYNQMVSATITQANAITFTKALDKYILPAIENKTSANIGVIAGLGMNRKLCVVSTDGNEVKLTMYINVPEDVTIDPNNKVEHVFETRMAYKYTEGGTPEPEVIQTGFYGFYQKLKNALLLDGTIYHGFKYAELNEESRKSAQPTFGGNNTSANYQAPVTNSVNNDFSTFMPTM